MTHIGVLPHVGKQPALDMAQLLVNLLEQRGVTVWLEEEAAQILQRPDLAAPLAELDAGIVLGGDGAFLRAGRRLAVKGIPLLGVNYGHLGFLTEIEPDELDWALGRLISGEYDVEERLMLEATVCASGDVRASYEAINDVVVARGTLARLVQSYVYIGDSLFSVYRGDGVIVATPTGSTAYSLSAGGPIVHPGLDTIVITPICPHTMGARSLVTAPDEHVTIRFDKSDDEMLLTVDGQLGVELAPGDEVRIRRAERSVRLIRLHSRTFYDVMRLRLSNAMDQTSLREKE